MRIILKNDYCAILHILSIIEQTYNTDMANIYEQGVHILDFEFA